MLEAIIRTSKKFCRSVILPLAIGSCSGSAAEYGSMADSGTRQKDAPQEKTELSPESWINIGTRNDYACGLRKNGVAECWGVVSEYDVLPERVIWKGKNHFEVIGDYRFIRESGPGGILRNGQISTWEKKGGNNISAADFPPGSYNYFGDLCAIQDNGRVVCEKRTLNPGNPCLQPIPEGAFTEVEGYCGIKVDGTIACWDEQAYWPENWRDYIGNVKPEDFPCLDKPRNTPPLGTFTQLEISDEYHCALSEGGTVDCWIGGYYKKLKAVEPSGRFRQISIDNSGEGVGVREDGTLEYWSRIPPENTYSKVPNGRFVRVASGGGHACAIREGNQSIACWGTGEDGKPFRSPYE